MGFPWKDIFQKNKPNVYIYQDLSHVVSKASQHSTVSLPGWRLANKVISQG
jgi:hypothetical protein